MLANKIVSQNLSYEFNEKVFFADIAYAHRILQCFDGRCWLTEMTSGL